MSSAKPPVCHYYSIMPWALGEKYDEIVAQCHAQGITEVYLLTSLTGKLLCSLERMKTYKDKFAKDGLHLSSMNFSIGHPDDGTPYFRKEYASPDDLPYFDGDVAVPVDRYEALLSRGFRYAVNEFGKPVFFACPNQAWMERNIYIIKQLATVFDLVWYDDEFRMDGDQFGGTPVSTASCYCDDCIGQVSKRVGRRITRADVLADQALHEEWTRHKVDKLAACWQTLSEAGGSVNPNLSLGLMIRWGGEERDGLDVDRLLAHFGKSIHLRAGEGHFTAAKYLETSSPAVEHLVAGYHVGWFPWELSVLTETTYMPGVTREMILKKAALGLAAGATEVAYCPCVPNGLEGQIFIARDKELIAQWAAALPDKTALHRPIAILRTAAAGRGDKNPARRVRDRQPFPLFSLAGLPAVVVRKGARRDHGQYDVVAITGRSVWETDFAQYRGQTVVLDGYALLENAPAVQALGIRQPASAEHGLVTFISDFKKHGLLWIKDNLVIVPYLWQDVPEPLYTQLLTDIRKTLAPRLKTAYVDGATHVMVVPHRYRDHDAILLVNTTMLPAACRLVLPGERKKLFNSDGQSQEADLLLAAQEIRILLAK